MLKMDQRSFIDKDYFSFIQILTVDGMESIFLKNMLCLALFYILYNIIVNHKDVGDYIHIGIYLIHTFNLPPYRAINMAYTV